MEDIIAALKDKIEREKSMLTEENRKLTTENDRVSRPVQNQRVLI